MNINNNEKKYKSTETLVYSCQYHVIWTTKYRRKVLTDVMQSRLKELIISKQQEYKYDIIDIEIMSDHVHLLLDINPYFGIYKTIGKIKGFTSNRMRKEFKELTTRLPTLWTRSKFISTVGAVSLEVVKKYIENQKNV
ncbi:MAG: IS200/IS605 family transposase [Candidatus Babeliales bacterium]